MEGLRTPAKRMSTNRLHYTKPTLPSGGSSRRAREGGTKIEFQAKKRAEGSLSLCGQWCRRHDRTPESKWNDRAGAPRREPTSGSLQVSDMRNARAKKPKSKTKARSPKELDRAKRMMDSHEGVGSFPPLACGSTLPKGGWKAMGGWVICELVAYDTVETDSPLP